MNISLVRSAVQTSVRAENEVIRPVPNTHTQYTHELIQFQSGTYITAWKAQSHTRAASLLGGGAHQVRRLFTDQHMLYESYIAEANRNTVLFACELRVSIVFELARDESTLTCERTFNFYDPREYVWVVTVPGLSQKPRATASLHASAQEA